MRVSIVIPTYNGAWRLARTLRSVLDQTLQDFEVILIDDGSSDETLEIARAVAGDDPRFRIFSQANRGVAATRNRALSLARGDYVAPLDQDDVWRPEYLQASVQALDASQGRAAMAFARSVWIDADDHAPPQTPLKVPLCVDYRELLLRNPIGNGSCMVARRDALQAVGYDEDLVRRFGQADDWWTQLQLSWRGKVLFIDAPLVGYRISAQATSHVQIERMARATLEIIRRARRQGPPLRWRDYLDARSLALVWLARRAIGADRKALALRLGVLAYATHPLWWLEPDLRGAFWRGATAWARKRAPSVWRELLSVDGAAPRPGGTPHRSPARRR